MRSERRWLGFAALGWALWYAVAVRAYAGVTGEFLGAGRVPAAWRDGFRTANLTAAGIIALGGLAALALCLPWPPWLRTGSLRAGRSRAEAGRLRTALLRLLRPVLAVGVGVGGLFAFLHGTAGLVLDSLELGGGLSSGRRADVVGLSAAERADITRMYAAMHADHHDLLRWDVLFYEPWFLVMGILLILTAWRYRVDRAPGVVTTGV